MKDVKIELGKKGEMLLTTTERLREARKQSTSGSRSMKAYRKVQSPVVGIDGVDGIRNSTLTPCAQLRQVMNS